MIWAFVALASCYLAAFVGSLIFLLYHINLWKYPVYYSAPLILAVYLPASVTILLPLDYVSHNAGPISGLHISDKAILLMWKGTYWTTFLLTWVFLPILQEFYRVGNYSKLEKLKASLKRNAKFQAITLLCSVACAIYLILEAGFTFRNLKSMIIALSHIYALVLALWLMAHGMVVIPKNKWLEGNFLQELNHNFLRVPKLVDVLEDTKSDFREDVLQVLILKENFTDPVTSGDFQYRDWILDLEAQIPEDLKDTVRRQYVYSEANTISREQVTNAFMTKLTHNFQTHFYKLSAHSSDYDIVLNRIVKLQKLIDARCAQDWTQRLQNIESSFLPAKMSYYYQCFAAPILARVQSILVFLLSVIIIESEFFHSTELSLINVIAYKLGIFKHNLTQAICLSLFFMYMIFCSVNSLARLKVFNMYHLVRRNSDPVSACFYGSYIARMTVPLSYNFVALFTSRKSIFEEWYGQSIHLAGLFNLMNNWIPRLLLVPVILTTFDLYDKIKNKIGLKSGMYGWADFDDADVESNTNDQNLVHNKRREVVIAEAKRLVAMELNRRESKTAISQRPARSGVYAQSKQPSGQNPGLFSASVDSLSSQNYPLEAGSDVSPALWGRVSEAYRTLKSTVSSKLERNAPHENVALHYRDQDDAEDHLIV
ncbi:hypothetical protein OXX79_008998 [Metschnikowia pulcherrima]